MSRDDKHKPTSIRQIAFEREAFANTPGVSILDTFTKMLQASKRVQKKTIFGTILYYTFSIKLPPINLTASTLHEINYDHVKQENNREMITRSQLA